MKRLLVIFSAIILFAGCDEKIQPVISEEKYDGKIPIQESWDSEIVFTEAGRLQAILYADHIYVLNEENQREKHLENMKIDFYNKKGVISSVLTSKRGKIDDATSNMWAIDSVVAVSDSGVVLETDELMWRHKDDKIVTEKFVTITSDKEKMEGYGFESDQHLVNYTIFNITYITSVNQK